jgi:hypothetical protein
MMPKHYEVRVDLPGGATLFKSRRLSVARERIEEDRRTLRHYFVPRAIYEVTSYDGEVTSVVKVT